MANPDPILIDGARRAHEQVSWRGSVIDGLRRRPLDVLTRARFARQLYPDQPLLQQAATLAGSDAQADHAAAFALLQAYAYLGASPMPSARQGVGLR